MRVGVLVLDQNLKKKTKQKTSGPCTLTLCLMKAILNLKKKMPLDKKFCIPYLCLLRFILRKALFQVSDYFRNKLHLHVITPK